MSYPHEEEYKSTVFDYEDFPKDWPKDFAILTAYPPTGEVWTPEQIETADRKLEAELRKGGFRLHRILGYSKDRKSHEKGWAVPMSLQTAWELGIKYKQVAIFYYQNDVLLLVYCQDAAHCNAAVVKVARPAQCKTAPYLNRIIKK